MNKKFVNKEPVTDQPMAAISRILIANRGEIACRIARTARALGYRTVAVFAADDADAPHVTACDEAVRLEGKSLAQTNLKIEAIIDAAKKTDADAIHPGYGFLSENSALARACIDAGLVFIGPPPAAIELMGNKRQAKIAMQKAGVPCITGYEGAAQDDGSLAQAAKTIGFPLMLKAAAGGGGRGMRLVQDAAQLTNSIRSARSEARNAFGSDELIIEKAIAGPRHIEIQVFADTHGNCVYLGERDCSLQRRHQKVLEEAPSPFVDAKLRKLMGEAAVAVARVCNYVGAGTVEFLVDAEHNFYFLEMNTRLQVEHPVTELVTGQDLVEWQLRVANTEPLPLTQQQISLNGHAIEVRLYAEDPALNFLPQTGRIQRWRPAGIDGVRIDSGIREHQSIGAQYDPMLAKIIAHGATREEARRRLLLAVEDSVLLGVADNRAFLATALRHPVFMAGGTTTAFIANELQQDASLQVADVDFESLAVAALLSQRGTTWRNSAGACRVLKLKERDQLYTMQLYARPQPDSFQVSSAARQQTIRGLSRDGGKIRYEIDGIVRTRDYVIDGNQLYLTSAARNLAFTDVTLASTGDMAAASRKVTAAMDGIVITLDAVVGARVERGQTLIVMEAMKMQHELKAGIDGVIRSIHVTPGTQVKLRQVLIDIDDTQTAH